MFVAASLPALNNGCSWLQALNILQHASLTILCVLISCSTVYSQNQTLIASVTMTAINLYLSFEQASTKTSDISRYTDNTRFNSMQHPDCDPSTTYRPTCCHDATVRLQPTRCTSCMVNKKPDILPGLKISNCSCVSFKLLSRHVRP